MSTIADIDMSDARFGRIVHSFLRKYSPLLPRVFAFAELFVNGKAGLFCIGDRERLEVGGGCLLYTSPSPRDVEESRMPSSA